MSKKLIALDRYTEASFLPSTFKLMFAE